MRSPASILAEALLDALKGVSSQDHAQAADAAIGAAVKLHIPLGELQREVKRLLPRYDRTLRATLKTKSGDAGAEAKTITSMLEKALNRPVSLEQHKADLIGGATLRVGDDLFDTSIRGALDRAEQVLKGNILSLPNRGYKTRLPRV